MRPVRSQDVIIAASLFAHRHAAVTHAHIGRSLGLPASRVSESIGRLQTHGLYSPALRRVRAARFLTLLVEGLPWLWPTEPTQVVRGMPTSHAGPVLRDRVAFDHAYVWPVDDGSYPSITEGRAVEPIHPLASVASRNWPTAYAILSLADAGRVGRVRERAIARDALRELLAT